MLRRTVRAWRQSSHRPRQTIPLELNPLTRWSRSLPSWSQLPRHKPHLDQLTVGLQGCHAAFNATNSIRTCLFFGTREPPDFLALSSWRDIASAQVRREAQPASEGAAAAADDDGSCEARADEAASAEDEQWNRVALFGEHPFLAQLNTESPIVALENFASRSESILTRRVPFRARLVVGHENHGVSAEYLEGADGDAAAPDVRALTRAEAVLYVPQYGTISSLNVVTSLGIALFYAFLDEHYPHSRVLSRNGGEPADSERARVHEALQRYQACFQAPVPTATSEKMCVVEEEGEEVRVAADHDARHAAPRVDPRPLHPHYYRKDVTEIQAEHKAFRASLLAYSNETLKCIRERGGSPPVRRTRFGLSVLYENDYDQRNFGGLIRNANAFLVDRVCYMGKRRYNVVGAVGTNHYTPPLYLGKTFDDVMDNIQTGGSGGKASAVPSAPDNEEGEGNDELISNADFERTIRSVIEDQRAATRDGDKLTAHQELIVRYSLFALHTREKIEKACGGPIRLWFLDCGHRNLYAEDYGVLRQMQKDGLAMDADTAKYKSSIESLVWYLTHCGEEGFTLSLCDSEETLFNAAGDGVVLVVPQEGKLPHITLLSQCEKILTVLPDDIGNGAGDDADVLTMRGLPSQVASGIALQRLSAVLHPGLSNL